MKSFKLIFFLLVSITTFSQSISVFDASYFKTDNIEPSLRVGKGFHINDVYRQTKNCFKPESIKLTSQQLGGKKTSIKLFYTKNNKEFSEFKSKGTSGSVSFLNLFEVNGKKLRELTETDVQEEERLIFTANVDFGLYSFEKDPILTEEAKTLIQQNKVQEFIKLFGSHYISGIRKESSITVILKKTTDQKGYSQASKTNGIINGNIPYRGKGSLELDNTDWMNLQLQYNRFSVVVEIDGPSIDQNAIKNTIDGILVGNANDKASAISNIIGTALEDISDSSQSSITQYYYAPFSLHGLEGINWDAKKQNELVKLNELLINLHRAKNYIEKYNDNYAINTIIEEYKTKKATVQQLSLAQNKFNETSQAIKSYNVELDSAIEQIHQRYLKCSDIFCISNTDCCSNKTFIEKVTLDNYENKILGQIVNLWGVLSNITLELNKPECEKRQQAKIVIENHSANPYDLYQNNKFIETISGKTGKTFYVSNGTYNFKAIQKTGYLLYPTENTRSVTISKVCQEEIVKIGF